MHWVRQIGMVLLHVDALKPSAKGNNSYIIKEDCIP